MDPNKCLEDIRKFIAEWPDDMSHDPYDFVELIKGLDQWISEGGALPDAWNHA